MPREASAVASSRPSTGGLPPAMYSTISARLASVVMANVARMARVAARSLTLGLLLAPTDPAHGQQQHAEARDCGNEAFRHGAVAGDWYAAGCGLCRELRHVRRDGIDVLLRHREVRHRARTDEHRLRHRQGVDGGEVGRRHAAANRPAGAVRAVAGRTVVDVK